MGDRVILARLRDEIPLHEFFVERNTKARSVGHGDETIGPAWNFSTVSSWRMGESSTQSSKMKASRQVLSQWSDAATVIGLV